MLGTSFVIWKDATYPPNPLRPPSVTGIFFFPYIITVESIITIIRKGCRTITREADQTLINFGMDWFLWDNGFNCQWFPFFFVMEIGTDVSSSDGLKNQLGRAEN